MLSSKFFFTNSLIPCLPLYTYPDHVRILFLYPDCARPCCITLERQGPIPTVKFATIVLLFPRHYGEVKLINLINQLYQDVCWCNEKIFRQAFDISYQLTKCVEGILLCSHASLRGSVSLQILHTVGESGTL